MKQLTSRCAVLMLALSFFSTMVPAMAQSPDVDPEADKILQSVSSYLGELQAFSFRASIENEIITDAGQKLQYVSVARLVIDRPAKLHFTRKGPLADVESVSDGKTFTMYSKNPNVYIQREAPGTVDDVIRLVEFETGLPAPGADLMFVDAYSIMQPGIQEASYIGSATIGGVDSHHLAFRGDQVDWQLWVKQGSEPLPTKYVITSKWLTGAPQFTLLFSDWNTAASPAADEFRFSPPNQAKQVDVMPLNFADSNQEE